MGDDGRTYIRVHDGMPDHPKVDALSDRAFRLLVESWCWCSRHLTDGHVPQATWARRGTPKARRELVDAGLVEDDGKAGVQMHDYLEHQRSRAVVEELSAARREAQQKASVKGNHNRWHVGEDGRPSPDCPLCKGSQPDPTRDPSGIGSGTPSGSVRGIGRGRGREEVVEMGGEVPDPHARETSLPAPIFDPENPRCARHAHIRPGESVPSCRDCAEVRRQSQQVTVDEQLAEQEERTRWRTAVDACPECDENGKIERPDGRLVRHHDLQDVR